MARHLIEAAPVDRYSVRYLLQDRKGDIYHGTIMESLGYVHRVDPEKLHAYKTGVHADQLYAIFDPSSMTPFDGNVNDPEVFIKRPQLIIKKDPWRFMNAPQYFVKLALREIEVLELTMQNPHPNVCQYLGVVLDNRNRIVGIALKRYSFDLEKFLLRRPRSLEIMNTSREKICAGVESAMRHFHMLGLVHCDIKPANIFLSANGDAVLGDFDSTHRIGRKLSAKIGTSGWRHRAQDFGCVADTCMDWYSLSMLNFRLHRFEMYVETEEPSAWLYALDESAPEAVVDNSESYRRFLE